MKFTGRLKPPIIDFATRRLTLLFETNEDFSQAYEEFKGCEKLSLEIKRYKAKRSLDANAYYWVLVTKLSKILKASNNEIHNRMLSEYGFPELIDGQLVRIPLPDTEEAEKRIKSSSEYHLKSTTQVIPGKDGIDYRTYIMVRGSSTYNTEEMARLIEGLISECHSVGMSDAEIMTPDEKRQLKERYGVNVG